MAGARDAEPLHRIESEGAQEERVVVTSTREEAEVVAGIDPGAPADYRLLAARLALAWTQSKPRRVGLAGGQGAGKSTLARLLVEACEAVGLRAAVLGIDDFYRTKVERQTLGASVHPLFETRGPPGTHDVEWCREALERLLGPGSFECPVFDKGRDDRAGVVRLEGPFDLVVLEGWCVGATPVADRALLEPVNPLEAELDPEGIWRREVNDRLAKEYAELWSGLDELVFLQVPGLDAVRRWRLQQESSLPRDRRLDAAAVDRFVQHYERVTRAMLASLPGYADWTVVLDWDHSVSRVDRRVEGSG
jgi:D-glycerate 3-kinase